MKRRLIVHGLNFTTVPVPVKTEEGIDLAAPMPIAEIELICPKGVGSSITHRIRVPTPADVELVKANFPIGGTVEMELRLLRDSGVQSTDASAETAAADVQA